MLAGNFNDGEKWTKTLNIGDTLFWIVIRSFGGSGIKMPIILYLDLYFSKGFTTPMVLCHLIVVTHFIAEWWSGHSDS